MRRVAFYTTIAASAVALLIGGLAGCDDDEDEDEGGGLACAPAEAGARPLEEAKLYFEFNGTDSDTGIHGIFDSPGFSELCVTAPDGTEWLAIKPRGVLQGFTVGGIFFESREPNALDMSQDEVLALFPPGEYTVAGRAFSGESLTGTAHLTHDIPKPPVVTAPTENEVVDPADVVVRWDPVTETVKGDPVTIVGYEVIVTNEDKDGADPNGMSHPIASIHVVPSVSSLTIPSEFFEPNTLYELELIAIEQSGNQTIAAVFFRTP